MSNYVTNCLIILIQLIALDDLDRILLDLPIMKLLGQHVKVHVTPLRRYEDFAVDIKERFN